MFIKIILKLYIVSYTVYNICIYTDICLADCLSFSLSIYNQKQNKKKHRNHLVEPYQPEQPCKLQPPRNALVTA